MQPPTRQTRGRGTATTTSARRRRARANGAARDEPRLRRARRDEHVTGGGDHRRRAPHAAQPVAVVQRLRAPRGHRRARCSRASRGRHARGEAQLQRLAPRARLARAGGRADGLRGAVRRASGRVARSTPASRPRSSAPRSAGTWTCWRFGPQIEGPHSPDERVSIPTVAAVLDSCLSASSTSPLEGDAHRRCARSAG